MSIVITKKPDQANPSTYPRLKRHRTGHHLIFLFTDRTTGYGITPPYKPEIIMSGLDPELYEDFPDAIRNGD